MESLLGDRRKAVEELTQGCEWAKQLGSIIDEPFGNDRSVEADHLIRKILRSFTDSISILNSHKVSDPIPPDTGVYSDGRKLGDSVGNRMSSSTKALKDGRVNSRKGWDPIPLDTWVYSDRRKLGDSVGNKMSSKTAAFKDGRLSSRKRKTPYNRRTKITADLPDEDGYEWRKCREKDMLGAKYPRSYYRCPLSYSCQATKQVQRIDPPMFETTYLGHHTCRNRLEEALLENSTTPANSNSPHFRMDSSNSSQVNDDPSYPTSTSTKTNTNKPPLIIFSYLT